ncbi:MAG TPA: DUF1206 domain-containing protein [Longimicrobiales bacterium]|nr:DUF1206 domain-containing protein [Longimicrobiales bacterium]
MIEPIRVVQGRARTADDDIAPWIRGFARLGFASRGVVYVLIGWIALQAALGPTQTEDSSGALRSLLDEPLGRIIVGVIAVGLACYTLWRAYAATVNPENDDTGSRLHNAGVAIVHAALTVTAAGVALSNGSGGGGGGSSDQEAAGWAARVMEWPVGRWLVAAAGVAIVGYGLYQLYRAATADLDDMLDLSELSATQREWVRRVSRFGVAARGVVFVLIGVFTAKAAVEYDASEARGFAGALESLQQQPYGPWLLGIVAAGLVSYGVYALVRARYRVVGTR